MDTGDFFNQPPSIAEKTLYGYLLELVRCQPPETVIDCYRQLFIDGLGYHDDYVWESLTKVVTLRSREDFRHILNRSWYIAINPWLEDRDRREFIPALVKLFSSQPCGVPDSLTAVKLRRACEYFTNETQDYWKLKLLAFTINQNAGNVLRNSIYRYPFLYEQALNYGYTSAEYSEKISRLRHQAEQAYQQKLRRYLTEGESDNPTQLTPTQIEQAQQEFTCKVDGKWSYQEQAKRLRDRVRRAACCREFKETQLYQYLSVSKGLSLKNFNEALKDFLRNLLPQYNSLRPDKAAIEAMCKKLLDWLIADKSENPNHYTFDNLLANLGASRVVGVILKIVLFCREVKSYVEECFNRLFRHYGSFPESQTQWLVEVFEHWNLATAIHFPVGESATATIS